jgi:phosphatidylinositol-3-phosphatase
MNPPGIHPSLPNYLWLEAGTNFGVLADGDPSTYHQSSRAHLVTLLQNSGISWKAYSENISGTSCPLTSSGTYLTRHDPVIFFDDVTNTNSATSSNCIAHVRPFTELASDLSANSNARYNFITPNACDDGHNSSGCATTDEVKNTDTWLAANVPAILNSAAYRNNGLLLITWDESEGGDVPIGMIVLSPKARGHGYNNSIAYTHSSTLRSLEEIFGVQPLLGDAANATDLSDLFTSFP